MAYNRLTTRQTALLNFIRGFISKNHYPPTYEEIRRGIGWSSKSLVSYHLDKLEAAGLLWRGSSTRTIILTATD